MKITNFFQNEYVDYGSYDNLRKIASIMDGQKNASRKILYTVIEKNIKDGIKVSQLGSKASEFTEYLHGNLDGVIVNMAQNFVGTNNHPILVRQGNFGTRFIPEASASRYIYTHKEKHVDYIFKKDDLPLLEKQYFEGSEIEPRYFVPTIPMLLVNGSEGISTGFAQKILPRNSKDIVSLLKAKLKGKKSRATLIPHFNGFNGTVEQGESDAQWLIKGTINRKSITKVEITEIPYGISLKDYLNILDDLEDKALIKKYSDKSENDLFLFEVQFDSKVLALMSDDDVLQKLKLIKKVTENYTCMSEENKIVVYDNATSVFEHYYKVKLDFMDRRKTNLIEKLNKDIKVNASKYIFIKSIVDGVIVVNNKKKEDIITQLETVDKIIQQEDSYDYLLRMPVYSLTNEKMAELKNTIIAMKKTLEEVKETLIEDMWLKDLEELEKVL